MSARRARRERGGVTLLLVMVLLVMAVLIGALAVRGATTDLRMTGAHRVASSAFYCAESGLAAARPIFAANVGQWNTLFSGGTPAGFTYPVTGDLDGDGKPDYSVTLKDNYDEFPPLANNPQVDNDLSAIMVSTCISSTVGFGADSRTLEEIVAYTGSLGTDYRYQAGHSSTHSGNEN